jgi:hypothetical protein
MDPSRKGDRASAPSVKQGSAAVSQASNKPFLSQHAWGAAALVTFVFTIFVAGWQWSRPVPYPPPEWTSFWKYILPLEFHAEQKLPDFENGRIEAVEVVPNSDRVWIAGDQGLLAYSDDGFAWRTYNWDATAGVPKKHVPPAQQATIAPPASLLPSVLAASLPQAQQSNPPPRPQSRTGAQGELQQQQQQPAANPFPLQIFTAIKAIEPTRGRVTVIWSTNKPASSQVEYGTSIKYGSKATSVVPASFVTEHQVDLNDLLPGTAYHFRVISAEINGQQAVSEDQTFTTLSSPAGTVNTRPSGAVTNAPPSGGAVSAPSSGNRFAVVIDSPRSGVTVSGNITLSAKVTGGIQPTVQFTVDDGKDLGIPVGSPPYKQAVDTVLLSNGPHVLVAVARSSGRETATSPKISIVVSNPFSSQSVDKKGPLTPAPDFRVVLFEVGNNGRLIATNLDQFSTRDGGATWQKMPQKFTNSETLRAPRVSHGLHPYDQSNDASVSQLIPEIREGMLSSRSFTLRFANPANNLEVRSDSWLVRSADGSKVAPDKINETYSAWGDGKNQAWVCGTSIESPVIPVILKTSDQGKTWTQQRFNELPPGLLDSAPERLYDITFQEDARHGWVVGDKSAILSTDDGGTTWHPQTRGAIGLLSLLPGTPEAAERYWKFPPLWTVPAALFFLFFVYRAMQQPAAAPVPDSIATKAVRDSPLEPGEPDVLGLGRITRALSGFLRNEGTQPPITIAVNGEWGTGKSSLMNLLRKDLEKRRFCPVWFNAWHNQEEPNLLAALLQTVRIEAVPSTFSDRPWLRFRTRLLARRVKTHAALLAALAAAVALFWGYHSQLLLHKKHGVAKELAEQYLKLFPPGISEDEAKRRQQTVDGLAQVAKELATIPNQPSNVRKQIDEITQEIVKLSGALAQDAKVPADASAKLAAKVENLSQLASAENKQPNDKEAQERVKTLTGVLEEARQLAQQIVSVTQKPATPATSTTTAENRIQILGILGALLGVLRGLWKALTAFGANPASLLAALSGGTKKSALEEQTSFRNQFTREFEEVSWALRPATLSIFIDDLDRCRPEKVSELLEAVNYMTTSGSCLVILALERKTVEASVGLAFQVIAEERNYQNPDGAPADADYGDGILGESRRRRGAFAKLYLDKLLNIEVDVPKLRTDRAADVSRREEAPAVSALRRFGDRVWAMKLAALGIAAAIVLTVAGYYAGGKLAPSEQAPPTATQPTGTGPETQGGTSGAAQAGNQGVRNPEEEKTPPPPVQGPPPVYHEGMMAHPKAQNAGFWLLVLLVAAAIGVVIRTMLYARRKDLRAVEKDSDTFQAALKIWLPVVEERQPTPRSVKRFLNRVRFLACLQQPEPDGTGPSPIPESILIALAALYKIDPKMLSDQKQFDIARDLRSGYPAEPLPNTLDKARRAHEEAFHNWGELSAHCPRFLELLPGFTQH